MSSTFKIVSYYTIKTVYEDIVKRLIDSCCKFNISITTRGYESLGDWKSNLGYRPLFIRDMLNENKTNIVYIDADAEICQYPKLFNSIKEDFAAHYREINGNLLGGTMFFANNNRVKNMVDLWIDYHKKYVNNYRFTQKVLQRLLEEKASELGISIYRLPPQYTLIFDTMKKFEPAIIRHYQASRKNRRKVRATKTRQHTVSNS